MVTAIVNGIQASIDTGYPLLGVLPLACLLETPVLVVLADVEAKEGAVVARAPS